MRHRVALVAKLAVAAGLVYWLVASGRLDFRELRELRDGWPWALAALVTLGGQIGLAAVRWHLLLRARQVDYGLRDAGTLTLIGWFFNQMVIGTTGGDLVKAYAVATERPDHRRDGVVSIFVDRALGLLVMVTLAAIGVLLNLDLVARHATLESLAATVWGLLGVGLGLACFYFSRRLRRLAPVRWARDRLPLRGLLQRLDEAVFAYRFHTREIALAIGVSFAIHGLLVVTNLCLARALLDGPLPWRAFFLLVPLAHVIAAIPVNPPGAVGTAEALYAYFFGLVGLPQGGLICLLQRLGFYLWALPGALLYVARRGTGLGRRGAGEPERELSS